MSAAAAITLIVVLAFLVGIAALYHRQVRDRILREGATRYEAIEGVSPFVPGENRAARQEPPLTLSLSRPQVGQLVRDLRDARQALDELVFDPVEDGLAEYSPAQMVRWKGLRLRLAEDENRIIHQAIERTP